MSELVIREIVADEFIRVWPFFQAIAAGGDTYTYPHDIGLEQVGSSRVDLQACKLEYSIVSPK